MKRTLLALSLVATASLAAVDVDALWNYADPAASESRFREALKEAKADDALILRTQVARTLGLRNRFEEARSELDGVEAQAAAAGVEVRVRLVLERGRWLRSSGRPADSVALFEQADAALAMQLALEADAAAAGEPDPYVHDELALLQRAAGNARAADDAQARAAALRRK